MVTISSGRPGRPIAPGAVSRCSGAHALEITQYTVLTYLMALGESRVRDLGDAMVLEETTLTRNLRLLEQGGWVRSRPGEDRRERLVSITPTGLRLVEKARPLWQEAQDRMQERLSKSTWDATFRTLPRIVDAARGEPS